MKIPVLEPYLLKYENTQNTRLLPFPFFFFQFLFYTLTFK